MACAMGGEEGARRPKMSRIRPRSNKGASYEKSGIVMTSSKHGYIVAPPRVFSELCFHAHENQISREGVRSMRGGWFWGGFYLTEKPMARAMGDEEGKK